LRATALSCRTGVGNRRSHRRHALKQEAQHDLSPTESWKPCKSKAGTCVITPPDRGRAPRRSDGQTPRGKIFAASAAIHTGAQRYLHEVRYVPGNFVVQLTVPSFVTHLLYRCSDGQSTSPTSTSPNRGKVGPEQSRLMHGPKPPPARKPNFESHGCVFAVAGTPMYLEIGQIDFPPVVVVLSESDGIHHVRRGVTLINNYR
jgi:hypothetical protein